MSDKKEQNSSILPELLAPAGSIECFHAAIDAGADAVYLGTSEFNARLRAKNFTSKTLSYLVPYAHDRNVKVYVTLNTLIKQSELENVIHTLYQLEQIGVDGLIVTDPGVIRIARSRFPGLKLHGSTQMIFHNSAGALTASRLGLSRIVLSRELTKEEITAITRNSPVELEAFVHGALCYSISGACLASSFLGGASGNRGRCTQVCRRNFRSDRKCGYFFSPRDLCGLDHIPFYIQNRISSLKIEGRMKGPEYVHTVVSAYRLALDHPDSLEEAARILSEDLGRAKCAFFLDGIKCAEVLDTESTGTGIYIGNVVESSGCKISVDGSQSVMIGDRIRVQPPTSQKGEASNVLGVEESSTNCTLLLKTPVEANPGDPVYLVSRKSSFANLRSHTEIKVAPRNFKEYYQGARRILEEFTGVSSENKKRDTLWIKIDHIEWLKFIEHSPCQRLIFAGDYSEMPGLLGNEELLSIWRSRLCLCLPPFIPEEDLSKWRKIISRASSMKIKRWVCANIGQIQMFHSGIELIADNPFWCMNNAARKAIGELGVSGFVYSLEDDLMNVRRIASGDGILCLYSSVPLFISRIFPSIGPGKEVTDTSEVKFIANNKNGLFYLLSKDPFCIANRKEKMSQAGINNFLIDLCFSQANEELFRVVIDAYKNGTKPEDSTLFNFKAGLK